MFGLLCNEPWCWTPAVVGKLTDWQVWEIIVKAAARRKGKRAGLPPKKAGKSRMPSREEYILVGTATFGQDAEALGREYDRVMAEHGNK